jgi:large subunit ribosomal protein L9
MHVILRQDVEKLGKAGEVIKVKDGYARNFLFPKNLAFPDGDSYMNRFKETTKSKTFKTVQAKKSDDALKRLLEGHKAVIKMKVGEEGKLFGSVTSQNIADELKKAGIEIDKRRILLEENIKHLGEYKIGYKSHSETEIMISLNVEAAEE